VARLSSYTGKDISDPVVPPRVTGKRRDALTSAVALKQAKVPFTWGGRRKEDGVDSVGFVALALSEAGMPFTPEILTAKSLRNLLNVTTEGEPKPGTCCSSTTASSCSIWEVTTPWACFPKAR
jgi:hypothetical protein